MRIPCPTCKRKGTVPRGDCIGKPMMYYNPMTGDSFPQETCQTCNGCGWVDDGTSVAPARSDEAAKRLAGLN